MLGLSLAVVFASPVFAQQGRGGFGRGGGFAMLLGNASVQKELKLDDEQTGKATKLGQELMATMREKTQDLSQEDRREKMPAIMEEVNESAMKSAGEFLKAEQVERLKQISLQTQGIRAFGDPEVAKKLNLTDTQKSDIQTISQEVMEELRGVPFGQDQSDEERAANNKKRAEINKGALEKVAGKLNDEQQKTWKTLIGSPFKLEMNPRPAN
jgi:O6-methylguanine-DNA--protein-cysteine methyltransferase